MPHVDITIHNNTPWAFAIQDREDSAEHCRTTVDGRRPTVDPDSGAWLSCGKCYGAVGQLKLSSHFCDVCKVAGTAFRCQGECDWDMCRTCAYRAPGAPGPGIGPGDIVTWRGQQDGVPTGPGKVLSAADKEGKARVEFPTGTWVFSAKAVSVVSTVLPPGGRATLQLRAKPNTAAGAGVVVVGVCTGGLVGRWLVGAVVQHGCGLQGQLRLVCAEPSVAVTVVYNVPVAGDNVWSAQSSNKAICLASVAAQATYESSDKVRAKHLLCTIAPNPQWVVGERRTPSMAKAAAKAVLGVGALIVAAESGDPDAIGMCAAALFSAVMGQDTATIKELVTKIPGLLQRKNSGGETPMELAKSRGKLEALCALIEAVPGGGGGGVALPEGVPPKTRR